MNHGELIARLRETASKGISVWGDLLNEAADALSRLTAGDVSLPEPDAYRFTMLDGKSARYSDTLPPGKLTDGMKLLTFDQLKDYGDRRAATAVLAERARCAKIAAPKTCYLAIAQDATAGTPPEPT
jgi:hypothetical protein